MDRRSFLLNIVNLDKYKENLFNYVFYNIIPDTVDGKTVKDSGKTKLVEIQGNGVIENQLCDLLSNHYGTTNGTLSIIDDVFMVTLSVDKNSTFSVMYYSPISSISGHKYLVSYGCKTSVNGKFGLSSGLGSSTTELTANGNWQIFSEILSCSSTGSQNIYTRFSSALTNDVFYFKNLQAIDLTLMFGTGNEPTTINDNRIQVILNRGYIAYNTGIIKNADMGEIESEPYNLFDEEWRQGDINQTTGELYNTGNNIRSTNLNSVIGGQTYTFEWDRTSCNTAVGGYTYLYIYEYDKNGNYIYFNDTNHAGITVDNKQLTLTSETAYVRVKIYSSGSPAYSSLTKDIIKLCVHRTGTRTGYAPYINSIKLNHFKPNKAGSVEDTYNDFVFTRKVGFVDLGTLNYTYQSNVERFYAEIPDIALSSSASAIGNISCSKYTPATQNDLGDTTKDKVISVNNSIHYIYIRDTEYTDATAFKNANQGVILYYELATPTTITMARNHLQVVDLGSLNWTYQSGSTRFYTYDLSTLIVKPAQNSLPNGWCSKYLLCSWNDKAFGYISVNNDGMIIVMDSNYTDSATFTTAMSGVYLFYETASPLNEFASGVLTDTTKISLPATFELNGAIATHDTFTINSQGYVFTRNIWNVDLGSLGWQYAGANIFYASLSDVKSTSDSSLANIVCPKYTTVKRNDLDDQTICVSATDIITKDTSYSNAATYKTAMSGIYAQYELATPQVITIPKGHLGCVDLGTLDWRYADNLQVFRVDNFPMKSRGELFVLKYITDLEKYPSNILDKQISNRPYYTNNNLFIKDTAYSDATVFKQAMAGVYLFYETDTETNDFVSKAIFERGGTINTNEFSWVENQLVGHGNFDYTGSAQSNNWYSIQTYYSLSVANDKATITKTASGTSAMLYKANADMPITLNHKYFIRCCVKCSTASSVRVNSGVYGTTINLNANQITWLEDIYDVTSMNQLYLALVEMTDAAVGTTYEVYYFMSFDLTLGFGAGNEPTDIRDPRIQRIIQLGYIPTNTNGTLTNVQNEVLANVKMKLQVK